MKFRAQAAVEYLMILAVVIIIALVVVGVLGGFPTLASGISEKESAAYWTTTDVGIVRQVWTAAGMSMVLRNNKNFAITVTGVNIAGSTNGVVLDQTLQPGETTGLISIDTTACSGTTYTKMISIDYDDATYTTSYAFSGAKSLVGTCQ
ncbi:MAG: hypothetical protein ABH863_06325 [Candidatus Micrarchaeota archaeon]